MNVRGPLPIRRITNVFGAVAYTLLMYTYVLICIFAVIWLVRRGYLAAVGLRWQHATPPEVTAAAPTEPQSFGVWLMSALLGIATVVVVSVVMIVLTYWLGRAGSRTLKRAIRFCQRPVTLGTLLGGKVLACGLATVPVLLAGMLRMGNFLVVLVLLALISLSLVVFLLQHYLAHTSEVMEAKDVW